MLPFLLIIKINWNFSIQHSLAGPTIQMHTVKWETIIPNYQQFLNNILSKNSCCEDYFANIDVDLSWVYLLPHIFAWNVSFSVSQLWCDNCYYILYSLGELECVLEKVEITWTWGVRLKDLARFLLMFINWENENALQYCANATLCTNVHVLYISVAFYSSRVHIFTRLPRRYWS